MKSSSFNEQSEKPKFIYKPNPLVARAYQIFEFKDGKNAYVPIGDYTVLDTTEEPEITDKRLFNIVGIMNEKKNLIDFKNLTAKRILFNIIPSTPESKQDKVIFRTYDGKGVSKENAVLTIEKGVFHEQS